MGNPIYTTDQSEDGRLLVGGIWRLWHQEGFPIELSYLHLREQGHLIDWMEAMADASLTDNLPALVAQMEAFLDSDTLMQCKIRFMAMLNSGQTYQSILDRKLANAPNLPVAAI